MTGCRGPLHADARRHVEGGLLPRRGPAARIPARARRPAAAHHGQPGRPADRRDRRRAPADQQGRRGRPVPRADADVDYLFLQVGVDEAPSPTSRTAATCSPGSARSRSSGAWSRPRRCASTWSTRAAGHRDLHQPRRRGGLRGASPSPGCRARPQPSCSTSPAPRRTGALLPTGHVRDVLDGVRRTCVDNGMPVVVVRAADLGVTGYETAAELEADDELGTARRRCGSAAGPPMGLGDGAVRAEDLAARRAARRRHDRHAHLHPGALPRGDRRARGGQRGDRAARCRRGRRRAWPRQPGPGAVRIEHPDRRGRGLGRARPERRPTAAVPRAPAWCARPASCSTAPSSPGRAQRARRRNRRPAMSRPRRPCTRSRTSATSSCSPRTGGEPAVLHRGAGPDRERPRRRLGVPAHLGRLRAPQPVKLTARDTSGIRRTGLRACSEAALERRVAASRRPGRHRLAGRRRRASGPRTVPRPGRARVRAVLGDRVVPAPEASSSRR